VNKGGEFRHQRSIFKTNSNHICHSLKKWHVVTHQNAVL
jgi:hypothetical protein